MDVQQEKTAELMPVIPLQGMAILPGVVIHLDLNKSRSVKALEQAIKSGGRAFAVAQKEGAADQAEPENLYQMGVIVSVKQVMKLPGQVVRILVEGEERGSLVELNQENRQYTEAWVMPLGRQELPKEGKRNAKRDAKRDAVKYTP